MTGSPLAKRSTRKRPQLPRPAILGCIGAGYAVMAAIFAVTPWQGTADFIVAGAASAVIVLAITSAVVEGRRRAKDRVAASLISMSLVVMLLPLLFTIGYTIKRGITRLSWTFLTHDGTGVGPLSAGGGISHAIIGTLEQVGIATVITVPLGLLVAIYLVEYGRGPLAMAMRFMVDVMTGIPSIVAGLFVLAFYVITVQGGGYSGFAGSIALAIIELPIIIRSSEEMLGLVPRSLREASYALGIPKWKTILRIVLPTSAAGIVTGVMLAIARVAGETAPVLLTVGFVNYVNKNPFSNSQASLATYIFQNIKLQGSFGGQYDVQRAWAGALTLIVLIIVFYVAARLMTRRNSLARR